MNSNFFYIALAVWLFTIYQVGFTESFSARPTQTELMNTVMKGMECARGVNERCWATQYQTNPVAYGVNPTNFFGTNGGWYLDQNLMGIMASKIRSLVPYYADPNTISNGTKNITMLTVTGVWAQVGIGDHTNQFTQTFAAGTNTVVYGDSPWRIREAHLDERYAVLNALAQRLYVQYAGTNFPGITHTARIKGDTGGTTNDGHVYYSWPGGDLGLGNNAFYYIKVDGRVIDGSGSLNHIILGQSRTAWGAHNGGSMEIELDAYGSGAIDFSADFELLDDSEIVKVYNCEYVGGYDNANESASYTPSSVSVSATLTNTGIAAFEFWPVINFPFDYCTDE